MARKSARGGKSKRREEDEDEDDYDNEVEMETVKRSSRRNKSRRGKSKRKSQREGREDKEYRRHDLDEIEEEDEEEDLKESRSKRSRPNRRTKKSINISNLPFKKSPEELVSVDDDTSTSMFFYNIFHALLFSFGFVSLQVLCLVRRMCFKASYPTVADAVSYLVFPLGFVTLLIFVIDGHGKQLGPTFFTSKSILSIILAIANFGACVYVSTQSASAHATLHWNRLTAIEREVFATATSNDTLTNLTGTVQTNYSIFMALTALAALFSLVDAVISILVSRPES